MIKKLFKIFFGSVAGLPFVLAVEVIPKFEKLNLSRNEVFAIGALIFVLILVFLYWFLQSRYKVD
jgi:hypothetical protein